MPRYGCSEIGDLAAGVTNVAMDCRCGSRVIVRCCGRAVAGLLINFFTRHSAESLPPIRASQRPINCTLVRILVQDRVRRQRWRSADALTPAARRKRLFGVDRGEQLLHGTRRRRTERLVEVDYLRKLLADEIIAPPECLAA